MFRLEGMIEFRADAAGPGDICQPIVPVGDIHAGAPGCDWSALRSIVGWSVGEGAAIIGMGDFFDLIVPADPRFDAAEGRDLNAETEYGRLLSVLEPTRGKWLFSLFGNHEHTLSARGHGNYAERLCRDLGDVPFGGYSCFYTLTARLLDADGHRLRSNSLVIYAHHGWFGGRKRGGKINAMEDAAGSYAADLYLFGHSHDCVASKRIFLTPGGARERCFVNTGTFYKTNEWGKTSYAERAGYPPTRVGITRVLWYPFRQRAIEGGRINGELTLVT